jgi:hypothetical protein
MTHAATSAGAARLASAHALREHLCAALRAERERTRAAPRRLAAPLRVLVPNRGARDAWAGALAAEVGAVAGLRVQTLWSAALELLGEAAPAVDDALFDALLAEAAAAEPLLARELGAYTHAYRLAAASASDFLSAGLADLDALDALPAGAAAQRARAVARAALRAREAARRHGIARHGDVYAAAAERIEQGAELGASAIWIAGVADATGQLERFLRALAARGATRLTLSPAPAPAAAVEARAAVSTEDEWAELALELRAELDAGTSPERIAIVARLDARATSIARAALELHGIPVRGGEVDGVLDPRCRLALARLELAEHGAAAPLDAWLDALGPEHALAPLREDLRLALRALGAARIDDGARLDLETRLAGRAALSLPARGAADDGDPAAPREPGRARARTLASATLYEARSALRELVALFASAPERAAGAVLAAWHARFDATLGARAFAFEQLATPAELELPVSAYRALVARRVRDGAETALFAARSGVWWLAPEQLHGLAFERVFAAGLLRGTFPRAAQQDPLLDDATRTALQARLPHLAPKSARADEEQRLWHELLGAAPRVRLSWPTRDADGRPALPAPFVRAFVRSHGAPAASTPAPAAPLPARAHLRALASRGALPVAADLFAALSAAERECRELDPRAAADERVLVARAAVLLEHGASAGTGLGPQHGWIGAQPAVPRHATFYENFARCAWQAWLSRELRLDAMPDPLGVLPELDALLLGTTVHGALEALLAPPDRPRELAALLALPPLPVPWPAAAALERALAAAAHDALAERGVHYRGLGRALAELARPYVERALELAYGDADPAVLGCEVEGGCKIAGREIRFRADRVDAGPSGPVLIDYKTGASVSQKSFPRWLRRGTLLQAASYAASASGATGVYLFLDPDGSDRSARLSTADLAPAERALAELAVATLGRAIDRGICTPRPEIGGKTNKSCATCAVASACSRNDTGWRLRWDVGLQLAAARGPRCEHDAVASELAALAEVEP